MRRSDDVPRSALGRGSVGLETSAEPTIQDQCMDLAKELLEVAEKLVDAAEDTIDDADETNKEARKEALSVADAQVLAILKVQRLVKDGNTAVIGNMNRALKDTPTPRLLKRIARYAGEA